MLDVYVVVLLAATHSLRPARQRAAGPRPARLRRGRRPDPVRRPTLRPAADLGRRRPGQPWQRPTEPRHPTRPDPARRRQREPPRPTAAPPADAELRPVARTALERLAGLAAAGVAVAIGASLLVRTRLPGRPAHRHRVRAPPTGIEAGKTDVRYKEVVIGKVQSVSLRDDRKRVVVGVRLDRSAAGLAVEDTHVLGRPAAHRRGRRHRPRHAALRAPTSAPTPASRPRRATSSRASRRRRSCCAASRARSSCCAPTTSARSTSARRSSTAAPGSAGSSATRSTPMRDELSVRVFVEAPYQQLVDRRARASGTRAASTSASTRAG